MSTKGSMNVAFKGAPDIVKKLHKLEQGGEQAIQRTVSDFASRAPAWVSKGIREHYGVDNVAIKEAAMKPKRGKTSISVSGVTVDGVTLTYKGRLLTPLHFKMSPKAAPTDQQKKPARVPGGGIATSGGSPVAMVRPPKKYAVKATIIKGQRVTLGNNTFIAPGKGGVLLPFQKKTEARSPIEAVRTLSVPQMIDGRAKETINEIISTNMEKRFQNHIQRVMK